MKRPHPSNESAAQIVLGIESSCDDTAAAVLINGQVKASVVSSQLMHAQYGGVIPELASRTHQKAVVTVVDEALRRAQISPRDITSIAYTNGPGLMGALLVGASFAKGLALALDVPLVAVDHLQGHVASLSLCDPPPEAAPTIVLIVSGGHTQIDLLNPSGESKTLGRTLDDAAGEAFDKVGKLIGLPYPGGAALDQLAESGDPAFHRFAEPQVAGLDFSFSGLKTAFLYLLRDGEKREPDYLERHRADLAAAIRHTIVEVLIDKLMRAVTQTGALQVGIVGGVSANRLLRRRFEDECGRGGRRGFIPPLAYCTDNAAMIAAAGRQLALQGQFASADAVPYPSGTPGS